MKNFLLIAVVLGLGFYIIDRSEAAAPVACNLVQIDGQSTSGGNAVLKLRQLRVVNPIPGEAAITAWAAGSGSGINARGHHGIVAEGAAPGGSGAHFRGNDGPGEDGGDGLSLQGFGWGAGLAAHGGLNAPPGYTGAGPGAYFAADGGNAAGLQVTGIGTMPGFFAHAPTHGALFRSDAVGSGFFIESRASGYSAIYLRPGPGGFGMATSAGPVHP